MSPKRALVLSTKTGKTTKSAEPKQEHGGAAETGRKQRTRTAADDLFDALLTVDGVEPGTKLTRTQGSMYGKLRRELAEVDATADDVTRRARRYRSLHPSWELTAAALVKHWGSLTPTRAAPKRRVEDEQAIDVGPSDWARAVYGDED